MLLLYVLANSLSFVFYQCFIRESHTFACGSGMQFSYGVIIWLRFQYNWTAFSMPVLSDGGFAVFIFHVVIESISES